LVIEKSTIKNVALLLGEKVLTAVIRFSVGIWVAKYLGPSEYGRLNYTIAFVLLFSPIASLGIGPIITRDLVKQPSAKARLLGTAAVMRLISSIIATMVTIGCLFLFHRSSDRPVLWITIAASSFLFQVFTVVEHYFEATAHQKSIVLARNIGLILGTIVTIAGLLFKLPSIVFIIAYTLQTIVSYLWLFFLYLRSDRDLHQWKFDFPTAIDLFQQSLPLFFTGVAVVIYLKIDQIMLGQMLDQRTVGIYTIAASLSEFWYFIPVAINSVLYPKIVKAKSSNSEEYQRVLQKYYDLVAAIGYGVSILIAPFSYPLIMATYGVGYLESAPILQVHILGCLFSFLGIAQGAWIVTEGLQRYSFYATASAAVINISLNLILIPQWEGLGAAIATLISYTFSGYLFYLIVPQTRKNALLATRSLFLPFRLCFDRVRS
jgi:polysaccharide transporter, PST family